MVRASVAERWPPDGLALTMFIENPPQKPPAY